MTELVFVHGWGFDASFWNQLSVLLKDHPQHCVDRGYFGSTPDEIKYAQPAILIGHSLGFVHGLRQSQNWAGWIAINSFARFTDTPGKAGCVPPNVLRDMRIRLVADPANTLDDFYGFIGTQKPQLFSPDANRLRQGLDELRDEDVGGVVSNLNVPGLVLASRNDPLVPVHISELLSKTGRQARLQWHETGGHILPQSDPAWCAATIKGFLSDFSNT